MAPANKNAKSGKTAQKPAKGGAPKAAKKEVVKQGSAKNNSKTKAPKAAAIAKPAAKKPASGKAAVPARKPAAKAAPVSKAAPAPKKKLEVAKKAPAKGKKEEAKPVKAGASKPVPAAKAPVAAKSPAAVKVPAVAKPIKPAKSAAAEKPPKAAKPPKVARVPKLPPAKGPMEKAQRSLAATAARAAAKDKVPPTKALSAVKEAVAKQQLKNLPADAKVAPKKVSKTFFHEVAPGAERIIKRGDKTTASPIPADIQNRRRGGGGEESPEELVERIERELEHQHIFKRNMLRPQLCTKCGINQVSERFTIDKELGYCDDCAEILHLGETKEARKIDFHPSLMKKDGEQSAEGESEDEDEDERGKGPAAGPVPEVD